MKQRPRRYITEPEMALIWDRWEKGESLNAIARDLGRYHSAVQGALARTGGIRPDLFCRIIFTRLDHLLLSLPTSLLKKTGLKQTSNIQLTDGRNWPKADLNFNVFWGDRTAAFGKSGH